jgi:hypothetical protein
VRVDEAMIREHRKMARLIGDMALGLNEARAARQRVQCVVGGMPHWRSCWPRFRLPRHAATKGSS